MQIKVFSVPSTGDEQIEQRVNTFLSAHRVVNVEKMLIADGSNSHWSLLLTYVDQGRTVEPQRRSRIDYREVLSTEDFATYARLRTLRKQLAEADGVPAYSVFTNEQLAQIVTDKVTTLEQMGAIAGIGDARLSKYGKQILENLVDDRDGSAE